MSSVQTNWIRVTGCSDSMYWYNTYVGLITNYMKHDSEGYWTVTPSGTLNVIKDCDCEPMVMMSVDDYKRILNQKLVGGYQPLAGKGKPSDPPRAE